MPNKPIKRVIREETRTWLVILAIVAVYLIVEKCT